METLVEKLSPSSLALAKELIEKGELVAFPTETVYGLGALATSDDAIKKVYQVKGRPSDNPLIVHVHKDYDLSLLVEKTYGGYAEKIAKAFLPGPLTMVYKSKGTVASSLSCLLYQTMIDFSNDFKFKSVISMPSSSNSNKLFCKVKYVELFVKSK